MNCCFSQMLELDRVVATAAKWDDRTQSEILKVIMMNTDNHLLTTLTFPLLEWSIYSIIEIFRHIFALLVPSSQSQRVFLNKVFRLNAWNKMCSYYRLKMFWCTTQNTSLNVPQFDWKGFMLSLKQRLLTSGLTQRQKLSFSLLMFAFAFPKS